MNALGLAIFLLYCDFWSVQNAHVCGVDIGRGEGGGGETGMEASKLAETTIDSIVEYSTINKGGRDNDKMWLGEGGREDWDNGDNDVRNVLFHKDDSEGHCH